MSFQLAIDDQLIIDGITYQVCAHPAIPGRPFVQAGSHSHVVQLRTAGGFVALKVQWQLRDPALVSHAQQLQSLSTIPGLQAARRLVITAANQPSLVAAWPELDYAILMPWLHGPTWQELIRHRRPLSPTQSLNLARALANLLTEIEQRGLAHGDLQPANVMLPGLIDPAATAPIALVDLETMHGVGIRRLPLSTPEGPYQHPVATTGLAVDRFGGALLILELLGWCDEQVRAASADESFFAPEDLLQPTERFHILRDALAQRWGLGPAQMLERLWQCQTPMACPLLKEWQAILPSSSLAIDEPLSPEPTMPSFPDPVIALIDNADTLRSQGQPAQALSMYRDALDRLPTGDPRASEVMHTIDSLEREIVQTSALSEQQATLSWSLPLAIGIITIVILMILAAIGLNRTTLSTATNLPTAEPTANNALPAPAPSPTAVLPSPTSPRLSLTVDRITPAELYIGTSPLELTVQGDGLSTVKTAILRAAGYEPIALTIMAGSSDRELRLQINNLNISIVGAIPFTLELNGTPVPGAAVTLRDYSSVRVIAGVRPEYTYSGRITVEANGVFTLMHEEPSPESAVTYPVRNGDEVEVLSTQPEGWYRLRIRTSGDQNLIGQIGYLERWLVDNTDVPTPPIPTPTVPSEPPRLRFVKLSENEDTRCILVQITGISTFGWGVSIDGLRLRSAFDSNGNARVCGLRVRQEVTFTVRDEQGVAVRGGVGVPTRGGDVMFAEWR
jgi:tRNA A-37 threonylcarbamoyl transferase component Bud32